MSDNKKGISIISLVMCFIAITLVTSAIVVVNMNWTSEEKINVIEETAYTKLYVLQEVETIAREAYVNEYLEYYDGNITLKDLETIVINRMLETIPKEQLNRFNVYVMSDRIEVEYK